jgi:hypothetical protein
MKNNFLKGFRDLLKEDFEKQMNSLGIYPQDVAEQYLEYFIVPKPHIIPNEGGEKYSLPGNILYHTKRRGENTVIIQDVSYPDKRRPAFANFPHGINASPNAGKEYVLTLDEYKKLIEWSIPPSEGPPL